jgi:hypothetical protein
MSIPNPHSANQVDARSQTVETPGPQRHRSPAISGQVTGNAEMENEQVGTRQ